MLSHSNVAFGFVRPCAPDPVGRSRVHVSNLARATHGLWMALDDAKLVPDFNSEDLGRPPLAHPKLQQRISELKQLPLWRSGLQSPAAASLFKQINVQKHFAQTLGEARILAQSPHSMWGDTDALSLLQLAGPKLILDAYDHADAFALSACVTAYSLIKADHAVRASLGSVVVDEMQMVDVLSPIQFSNYNDVVFAAINGNPIPETLPITVVYNKANGPALHVQINHPKLTPELVLTNVVRLYQNQRVLASFGVEDIAVLLNEPLSGQHLTSYVTLIDGAFHHVCNSIQAVPEPVFSSLQWKDCKHAFEQCCRYLGEDFMLQTTFGLHPSTTHNTLFQERLMKILPVLQGFLKGDETSWS